MDNNTTNASGSTTSSTSQNTSGTNTQLLDILTKADLISILEALFKFSQETDNAIVRKTDGLYVKDFYKEFTDHANDTDIHPTKQQTDILKGFTLTNGNLAYNNNPITTGVSTEAGNAIQLKNSMLFVPDLSKSVNDHINDTDIHITADERDKWNNMVASADHTIRMLVNNLDLYKIQIVPQLPTENIDTYCIYAVKTSIEEKKSTDKAGTVYHEYYLLYLYRGGWVCLNMQAEQLRAYLDSVYQRLDAVETHSHSNKDILDKFSLDANNALMYDNKDISLAQVSDDNNNAISLGSDGKLYVKDLSTEVASITKNSSLSKVVLLDSECDNSGEYELLEPIDNFNFIFVQYYLKPEKTVKKKNMDPNVLENQDEYLYKTGSDAPYDAKSDMIDTDQLNYLFSKNIDYMLEHDYGISTYNTKVRFHANKMNITYYNHVCIYRIIGVR